MYLYASVYVLDVPYFLDHTFDYIVSPGLRDQVKPGRLVTIPFGPGNRKTTGVVVALKETMDSEKIGFKPIFSTLDPSLLSLNEEMLGLCLYLKEHTLCTMSDAVHAVLPIAAYSRPEIVYVPAENAEEKAKEVLSSGDAATVFLNYIIKKTPARLELLRLRFGPATRDLLQTLLKLKLIQKDTLYHLPEPKKEAFCSLAMPREQAEAILNGTDPVIGLRSVKHQTILRFVLNSKDDEVREKDLLEKCYGVTTSQIVALCDKGILRRVKREVDRSALIPEKTDAREVILNEEQSAAYDALCALSDAGEAKAALLHGVTGSGKTSVMMKTIDHVLAKNKSVILLLPEIALTPQTLSIFCARYGERVAILHSGLSVGERLDAYRRIRSGGADVVIGTRSAIFAPLSNLGLIIIDEEHEHTYKSDMNPKYHARDVARFRCAHNKALLLLSSATPSFESYYKAKQGIYSLITLKHRYGGATLPKVTIADMREDTAAGTISPLGAMLCERLVRNTQEENQSILFLNRRGYNNFISCRSCGEAILCPTCSVSMTYHTVGKSYENGELRCHWCGKRVPLPETCPSCGSEHLVRMGFGTQRVEQELSELLPTSRILRMDTDTTASRYSYEKMLGTFRRHEADVLLGTQMVTKGHDFPDVTLVGVLSADSSLYLNDYRAAERTFAMLTQVIGRAGRREKAGEAIIQTNNPDHECIRLACAQDYETFYEEEIRLRKALVFPPFCDIALLTLIATEENYVMRGTKFLNEQLQKALSGDYRDVSLVVFGPFEAPVYKVENKYRMRMVIKCRLNKRSRALFSEILSSFSNFRERDLILSVDFNPSSL